MLLLDDEVGDSDGEDGGTEDGPELSETTGAEVSVPGGVRGTVKGDPVSALRLAGGAVGTGVGIGDTTGNGEGCREGPGEDIGKGSGVDGWEGVGISVENPDGECVGGLVGNELLSDPVHSINMTAKSVSPAETSSQSPLTFAPKTNLSPLLAASVIQLDPEVPS